MDVLFLLTCIGEKDAPLQTLVSLTPQISAAFAG